MELTIIILYLLAIFGVGIYCNKFNKGLDGVVPCKCSRKFPKNLLN